MEQDLLRHILDVSRRMAETRDLASLLNHVMDEAIQLVGAERGYVVLMEPDGSLDFRAHRGQDGQVLADTKDQVSRSVLRQVVEASEPLVLRDAGQDPRFSGAESVVILGLRSIMCVPLISRGDTIGAICVENRSIRGRFRQEDVTPLILFANQAAVAIENARLLQSLQRSHDELEMRVEERTRELSEANASLKHEIVERKQAEEALRRRAEELDALQATVLDIIIPHDLPTLLETIVERAARLLDAPSGGLYLCAAEQKQVRCVVSYNTPRDYRGTVLDFGEGASGTVARTGEPLIVDDYRTWEGRSPAFEEEQPFRAVLAVPMTWQGQVTGVINVDYRAENQFFTSADLELLALFANHAAIAVENARLYEQAQREIAERKQAEAALREREEHLRSLFETMVEGVILIAPDGQIIQANPAAERILGLRRSEIEARSYVAPEWEILRPDGTSMQAEEMAGPRAMREKHLVKDVVMGVKRPDGSISWINVSAAPLISESGELGGVVGTFADITERVQAEEAIQQLYEQTRRDAETKAMLLREVNHRVKNNLTGIIGLIDTERRYASGEERVVVQAAMDRLVQRIIGLAQVHDMLSQSEWAPVPLSDLARGIISSTLNARPLDRQVLVEVSPSPVKISPRQASNLALVINELVTNTVKHAVSGRETVHVAVRIAHEDDDVILLEYRDNGPGYPEDVLRLERRGVGLYLVQNLVGHVLHGSLALANDGGAVTTIRFEVEEESMT